MRRPLSTAVGVLFSLSFACFAPRPDHDRLPRRLALGVVLAAALCSAASAIAVPLQTSHCADMSGMAIPPASIGLPTRGAHVVSATMIDADAVNNHNGAYCKIVGIITAQLNSTPDIRFEVNLPLRWNARALQMGGSGYSGVVVTGTDPTAFAPSASPLSMGYATFGSDSGHVGNAGLANFAMNDEAVVNFGYAHLKKTHDVAMALILLGYGRRPEKTYFAGGSTGGREAFTVIERFPNDYDGVIANAPAINFSGIRLIGVKIGQAAYGTTGGFVDSVLQKKVFDTVMQQCDGLDGAKDGIISDVEACRRKEPEIIDSLRCADAPEDQSLPAAPWANDDCLTDLQLHTLTTMRDGLNLPYPLAFGVSRYYGYNVFQGVDLTSGLGLGHSPVLTLPLHFQANGYLFAQADGYMKYFVTHDLHFDTLTFDVDHPGRWRPRLIALSATVGSMNPDMSAFIAHGGKLIAMHGLSDEVTSPNQTIAFYKTLVAKYGQDRVDSFMRLYMVPGFQHGNGVFIPAWDELGALDRWVSYGVGPETLVGTDISRTTTGRTRPLCRYPAFPRYIGDGSARESVNDARYFRCVER